MEAVHARVGGADKVPWKMVEQGAATSVLLATSAHLDGFRGRTATKRVPTSPAARPVSRTTRSTPSGRPVVEDIRGHAVRLNRVFVCGARLHRRGWLSGDWPVVSDEDGRSGGPGVVPQRGNVALQGFLRIRYSVQAFR
jgi:hypothetical protein